MLLLIQLIFLILCGLVLSDVNVCYFRYGQNLNFYCETNSSQVNNLTWKWKNSNESMTLFNCSLTECNMVSSTPLSLSASINLDTKNSSIVRSTLTGTLVNATNTNLKQFSNLICQSITETVNICRSIRIYANPDNVTCSISNVTSDKVLIQCWIYPSGRVEYIRVNDKIFSSLNNSSEVSSMCSTIDPESGQLYYTTKCVVYVSLKLFGPGKNQINVTFSPEVADSNYTITSNNIVIPVYDDLQDTMCSQPDLKVDSSAVIVDCLAPLYLRNVFCRLTDRVDGNYVRTVITLMSELTLDTNNTVALRCHFNVKPNTLGVGQHELWVTFYSTNSEGNTTTKTSNRTKPVSFYLPKEMNFTVNGDPDGVVVNIGDNVTFDCSVDGYPPPTATISPNPNYIIFFTQQYTYGFTVTGCYSSDVYACRSRDSLTRFGNEVTRKVYLSIPCPLRLQSERYAESSSVFVGKFVNTSLVQFDVTGYPSPISMTLYNTRNYVTSIISDGVKVVYVKDLGPNGNIHIDFINMELIRNQEKFTLAVDNGAGNTSFYFYIQYDQADKVGSGVTHTYGSTTKIMLFFIYTITHFIIY